MGNENNINLPDIIRNRKILPFEVKRKIINNVFFNCIIFIVMIIITLIINISFNKLSIRAFDSYIDIIQIFGALISIVILETAYRKDSGTIGIYGIEFLIFSISVLFVPYMYISKGNIGFMKSTILGFAIYYLAKSSITFLKLRHNYLKDNISDIKELVKENKESYLEEQSTKTLKLQKAEKELRKKVKQENNKNNAKKQDKQEKVENNDEKKDKHEKIKKNSEK